MKIPETILLLALLATVSVHAINLNQTDTFNSGLLENWNGATPDIGTGGPAGTNDNFLLFTSHGGGGANSKMVGYNLTQWRGNYLTAGVARVTLHLKNFSATPLQLRAVLKTAFGPSPGFASTQPFTLPPNSGWQRAVFELNENSMTRVNSSTLAFSTLITNVGELRIVHSAEPSIIGDPLVGSLGLDNIQALPFTGPELHVALMTNQLQLSWPATGTDGFRLESTDCLENTATWTPVVSPIKLNGTNSVVILPPSTSAQTFFRLNLP